MKTIHHMEEPAAAAEPVMDGLEVRPVWRERVADWVASVAMRAQDWQAELRASALEAKQVFDDYSWKAYHAAANIEGRYLQKVPPVVRTLGILAVGAGVRKLTASYESGYEHLLADMVSLQAAHGSHGSHSDTAVRLADYSTSYDPSHLGQDAGVPPAVDDPLPAPPTPAPADVPPPPPPAPALPPPELPPSPAESHFDADTPGKYLWNKMDNSGVPHGVIMQELLDAADEAKADGHKVEIHHTVSHTLHHQGEPITWIEIDNRSDTAFLWHTLLPYLEDD